MKIEKWIYKGQEIDVPILEDDEIETNDIKKEEENDE